LGTVNFLCFALATGRGRPGYLSSGGGYFPGIWACDGGIGVVGRDSVYGSTREVILDPSVEEWRWGKFEGEKRRFVGWKCVHVVCNVETTEIRQDGRTELVVFDVGEDWTGDRSSHGKYVSQGTEPELR
jgi:hypothetical protein